MQLIIAIGLSFLATFAKAQDGCFINFENDTPSFGVDPLTSVDCTDVIFSADTSDGGEGILAVTEVGYQGRSGQGLVVFGDDPSALQITFQKPAIFLELWFGNDDPNFTIEGDLAILTVFSGCDEVGNPIEVGRTEVVMNREDIGNQIARISVTTLADVIAFDSAILQYTDAFGVAINLIELVDDVTIIFDFFLVKCPCENSWKNHGAYVSCVSNLAKTLALEGISTVDLRSIIFSESTKSRCGK